ncbi:TetR/AcrR family transcriptional regulator [Actinomadura madurae]|uniref:TetR/AcrR family transcriptional regulator n=1 Tax=Actinomadura madurae TaxID=1993 RepID=UPI0020D25329|nr:TetR/AcrR family transcriptional regulator [Actinomadura madurae]MCP9947012.1 TetR/AcrR family transcriptional regulator [Actinomadura madurae]MCP9963783.1 TetR/AcrR family transcriptional regulator [Actinomadura madurae]MCP9976260.1 TetR/AcrR family transcriptional regulator [Actinomadura madurae]MCQ0012251.1 TetR/AcrR family transcriptional regulator [Actinomadura madurae]MCQ0012449.1 TetR/AcrR family transcriptional regulator [Actinomadura madurae]
MTAQALPREPQQDRSRATRQRLLEAAVGCLASVGWAGTTVAVVAERAGVSRGAAQHHFRTREELVTAAVEYGSDVRMAQMRERLDALADHRPSTLDVVTLLGEMYTSPLFRAALQLWVAASSDEQLRARIVPLEAKVGREAHRLTVEALGADESVPGVRETVQATLDLVRGLGLADLLTDDSARRTRLLRQWAITLDRALGR